MNSLKPRIFVSSTVKDLPNEREAAKRAIESVPAIPVMSEYTMCAVDKPSVKACVDEVKSSDFYILILGGRYGWELENGISITELEYDTALKERIPVFVFDTGYEKEAKQKIFAKKVGSQRFWKTITDAFHLEKEIKKSYLIYVEEQYYEKQNTTETLYSNLVEIEFPIKLYLADLNIDRNEVIEKSWETDFMLKRKSTQEKVVRSAIYQNGMVPTSDWVLHEKKMITFHDLTNNTNPLSSVIDSGTITPIDSKEFYEIDENYLKVFKKLLRYCLARKLYHMGINYKGNGIYAFVAEDKSLQKRKIKWHSKIDATRTVFELKMQKKDQEKVAYGKHFAMRSNFHLFNDKWYMAITPDWFISYDGYKESFYGYQQLSYLKRNERNKQVLNHLKFIVHQLTGEFDDTLFKKNIKYEMLKFRKLVQVEAFPQINENSWYNSENTKNRKLLIEIDENNLGLF